MAKIEEAIVTRIRRLIDTGGHQKVENNVQYARCQGWIASALAAIEMACPSPEHAYRKQAQRIIDDPYAKGYAISIQVVSLASLLDHLKKDVEEGLITSVANRARAETFDDFLDHADAYLKEGRKNEGAVIAGVVFEDTVRRICRDQGINENGVNLDSLVTALTKAELISGIRAKRARAAAGIRTSATHARWEEFELSDVKPVVDLTRELIAEHLDR